jgi:hypothetical protein
MFPFSFRELWHNLNRTARWLNGMQLEGGQVIHNDNGIRLVPGGSGTSTFSGTAYIAGSKTTGLGTKEWVRCFLDTATAEDNDGPPPDPFPPNEEWYEVSQTAGDIHIPRA